MTQLKQVAVAAMLAVGSMGAHAAVQNIVSLTITGGDFGMGAPAPADCTTATAFSNYQCVTPGTSAPLVMGSYQGTAVSDSITAFNFFNAPVTTFTAATAAGAANNPTGVPNGTVDTVAGTMTVDLGGFYANWSGTNFLQGTDPSGANGTSVAATGTYNAGTGAFDISWHSFITTAPFAGQTGYWHLKGTAAVAAAPVPLPAAAWLMGSGLLGLVGVARRRKAA